jgi:hypothetical protein
MNAIMRELAAMRTEVAANAQVGRVGAPERDLNSAYF